MKIAIIGGGWTGLVLAHHLAGEGSKVDLFERSQQLGGLSTYQRYGDFFWDRFYHVILPTDHALLHFIEEIGLKEKLDWTHTATGFYVDNEFYSLSSTRDFLLFPPLNLWQKVRLGFTIWFGSKVRDWRRVEGIPVDDWLLRLGGRATFENFWKPLLLAKLGENYHRVSAVFIWTYIKRLFGARSGSSAKREQMGYLEGGYKTAIDRVQELLYERNANIHLQSTVSKVYPNVNEGIQLDVNGEHKVFDKVIFTGPTNILKQIASPALLDIGGTSSEVEYLGVICMVLILNKSITPYYVLNIADDEIPFTGVIGMTNLVDKRNTGGCDLVYLPKYVSSNDPILWKSDQEIKDLFYRGLFKLYPGLKTSNIVHMTINRAIKVQPLQVLHYSKLVPKVTTLHKDFYVLNTSQFVDDTLNNNSVVKHVNDFVQKHGSEFRKTEDKRRAIHISEMM